MSEKIARYLTPAKFQWLLEDRGIYFSQLSQQSDKADGTNDANLIVDLLFNYAEKKSKGDLNVDSISKNELATSLASMNKYERDIICISSWYLGDCESEYMWNNYAKDIKTGEVGVCIISSTSKIRYSIPDDLSAFVELDKIDYNSSKKAISIGRNYYYKDDAFADECEFRLAFSLMQYSLVTGFEHPLVPKVTIGSNLKPSSEEFLKDYVKSPDTFLSQELVKQKGDIGFILKLELEDIISEIRLPPNCSEEHQKYFQKLIDESNYNFKLTHSHLDAL
ncbi:DUF2971 domain-containing protein [Pseudoalteromonas sp. 2CM39R]|uniref:DUF2971 domain-containing protein n=1 Tax=Pseudoalteromonas sp. 2CM39R TaxID=2929856 RepID=UPI0020C0626E|nr:DUF2971 domain-containing protein [Pseudoalteromonas sp. 2CM39R]MCK8124663.1 DUF2971 domain-containing protein [Pseudoalteromonas sp. 2CM39R]